MCNGIEVVVVGTAISSAAKETARIVVFKFLDKKLEIVTDLNITGTVYCFATIRGRLLAGVDGMIQMYNISHDESKFSIKLITKHHGYIVALKIKVLGDIVIIADVQKSISVLEYSNNENGECLVERCRDYNTNWLMDTEFLGAEMYVCADNSFNLFTLKRDVEAMLVNVKRRLEPFGSYNVSDAINVIRVGIKIYFHVM